LRNINKLQASFKDLKIEERSLILISEETKGQQAPFFQGFQARRINLGKK